MNFLHQLLEKSRLLTVLYENLPDHVKASEVYIFVANYLEKYAAFNRITPDSAIEMYTDYIMVYNKHCKQFRKTGKYPRENSNDTFAISRERYDIVLLFSVLFTAHRFRIMELLNGQPSGEKALFLGLGPGIEMALTESSHKEVHAYDLSISDFLLTAFPDIKVNIELYTGQYRDYFDVIYLIELLEHLSEPYLLLEICSQSLKKGGKVILTTATDIPQFDHLYNFPEDNKYLEMRAMGMGFKILFKEMIPHNYLTMDLKPSNHFYILQKA